MEITIILRPSFIAYPFHLCFTTPYIKVGDSHLQLKWGMKQHIKIKEGEILYAGFSYKGKECHRLAETRYRPIQKEDRHIVATLGPLNASPFRFRSIKKSKDLT